MEANEDGTKAAKRSRKKGKKKQSKTSKTDLVGKSSGEFSQEHGKVSEVPKQEDIPMTVRTSQSSLDRSPVTSSEYVNNNLGSVGSAEGPTAEGRTKSPEKIDSPPEVDDGSPRRRATLSLLELKDDTAAMKNQDGVSIVNEDEPSQDSLAKETSFTEEHVSPHASSSVAIQEAADNTRRAESPRRKATLSTLELDTQELEVSDQAAILRDDDGLVKTENGKKSKPTEEVENDLPDPEVKRRNLDPDAKIDSINGEGSEYLKRHGTRESDSRKEKSVNALLATGDGIIGTPVEETGVEVPATDKSESESKTEEKTLNKLESDGELPWAMYRSAKKRERSHVEELPELNDEDEAGEEGVLPDFDDVLNHLNSGEGELESENNPPYLFGSSQQSEMHKYVDELKLGLAEEEINEYLDEFEKRMEEEILMIGSISLEDVQLEERRLREEHIGFQQQQAKLQRDRKQEILVAMERAKKYVMQRFKEKYRNIRMREEHLMQRDRLVHDRIHRAFRRSENQLLRALKKRKGEVKTLYGDLIFADGQYGGTKGRRWKVDWNKTPQPIQIRLKCLRGVKDKLPGSRYVLMVSLYDRLGGHVMKWSNLKGQQWGGATLPLNHDGEFYNIELKIDQSVFTVCPARPDIRPGMVLVFELFILRGSVTPTDKVVGWGCFPICDRVFNVIEGKYKTPLLRGDMDPNIDKFSTIEKLMAMDLENWLCNLYFEIVKLPRYMAGQKEYEVELQFTSSLVSYPKRTKTGEEFVDGEKPIYGSHADLNSIRASRASIRSSHSASFFGSTYGFDPKPEEEDQRPGPSNMLTVDKVDLGGKKRRTSRSGSLSSSNVQLQKADLLSTELRHRKPSRSSGPEPDPNQGENMSRAFTVHGSRKVVEEKGVCLSDYDDSSGTDFSDDDVYNIKKDERYKGVKGQPGMFYKIHQNNPADVYAHKMFTMIPKTPKLNQIRRKKRLSHLEELQQHTYSVKRPWSKKGHIPRKGREKAQYIARMLLAELGLAQWRSAEFWAMLLMITITWWIRMFLHYLGQLALIYAMLIPINKYQFLPYTVTLNYQNTLLRTREEIGVIVIGHFTNIFVMILLVIFSWFLQSLFGRFPSVFSKFIMAFGLNTVFDPFWIMIVDSALLRFRQVGSDNPIGDAFKLYWHFNRYYTNDNVLLFISISITLFLYITTTFFATTVLYMYFLRLHNKGRMMDVFWRLQGTEEEFFFPFDLEVSHEEITFICKKAEQWRGEEGERRKTAVYDYVWEEEEILDEEWETANTRGAKTGKKEITTHVSIHTIHLDGLRELYRHFLRSPEGAIVEVFQEINVPGVDMDVKAALAKGTNFQGIDGLRRMRSLTEASRSRPTSRASSIGKTTSLSRRPSYFLDVPTFAPV